VATARSTHSISQLKGEGDGGLERGGGGVSKLEVAGRNVPTSGAPDGRVQLRSHRPYHPSGARSPGRKSWPAWWRSVVARGGGGGGCEEGAREGKRPR
jgi:hypothetical protein